MIPKIVYEAVVSRIKLLSGCNLAEKRRPQDGRIKREQGGKEVELRVSTMPTAFGEKAVLRIFDPDILLKGLDQLGLSPHDAPKFHDFIARPTGIILVTGPTGSGKTTTLYSVLKHLSQARGEHRHDRGPGRDGVRGLQPGPGAPADRRHLRVEPAHGAAPGPRHHHGRRDPRRRDRRPRGPGGPHRPPRAVDPAHERRAVLDHPAPRPRRAALPHHLDPHRCHRPAPRPRELPALRGGVRAERGRGARDEDAVREARRPTASGAAAAASTAGRPATWAAPASTRSCP